jgi:hypothetical protein
MVIRELAAIVLLGFSGAAPLLLWRARFGHWRATRVADLVDGQRVKVGGTVELIGPALRAPYIDVECVAYSIWREDPPPPDETGYHDRAQDFVLRDRAGDGVLVRAGDRFDLRAGRNVSHARDGYVDAHFILPGDEIYVVGVAVRVPDVDGSGATYREPPRRWMLTAAGDQPLVMVGRRKDRRS